MLAGTIVGPPAGGGRQRYALLASFLRKRSFGYEYGLT